MATKSKSVSVNWPKGATELFDPILEDFEKAAEEYLKAGASSPGKVHLNAPLVRKLWRQARQRNAATIEQALESCLEAALKQLVK